MARTKPRTDPHRPAVIIPSQYRYVFSYNCSTTQDGWPVPSFGINCELDRRQTIENEEGPPTIINGEHNPDGRCCQLGLLSRGYTVIGAPGKCGVCGAVFVYGDVWQHEPTGEYVHLGHDCADKYNMLADRSDWEMADRRARRAIEAQIARDANQRALERFCQDHPGLLEDLDVEHEIIADIKRKLRQYHSISDKQIALVRKLAEEVRNPPPPAPPEVHIAAPKGRVTFRGTVVSRRSQDTYYGTISRITVKITTPEGVWLAWGTEPASFFQDTYQHGGIKGAEIEITATLSPGKEPHFALMKRPHGRVLKRVCEMNNATCEGCARESREWCPVQRTPEEVRRDQESYDYQQRLVQREAAELRERLAERDRESCH